MAINMFNVTLIFQFLSGHGRERLDTLRHTFASYLVMQGVDFSTVMKLMGNADIQTTIINAHLASDHLADVVNKLTF